MCDHCMCASMRTSSIGSRVKGVHYLWILNVLMETCHFSSPTIGRVERRKGRRMEEKKHKMERWKGRWKDSISMLLHFLEASSEF